MKTLIIRKVPDDLHRRVKMAAAEAEQSMQDFIIKLMQKEVEKGKPKK
jgi:predicted HicB family RNase H-like nuclease